MGSLVAGVSLSTFPTRSTSRRRSTLRDFFITLFFVALGMTIPIPGLSVIGLALIIAAFTVVNRVDDDVYAALPDEAGSARQPARRSILRDL